MENNADNLPPLPSLPPVPPSSPFSSPPEIFPPEGLPFDDSQAQTEAAPLPGAENLTPAKRFWRKFGGDGFLISVGVHIILIIIALTWVTAHYFVSSGKPEDFVTGAGGGNQGDKVSMSEHRIKPKNARNMVKTPTKLVSKSTSASVSLPDVPNLNMSALSSGSLAGSASKGLGGGAGGGIGTGIGPGRGGGKNMVSLFGISGFNASGLIGTFYDFKQTAKGAQRGKNEGRYLNEVTQFFQKHWDTAFLERTVFHSTERLVISQFFIPDMRAEGAPAAFNVKVAPSNWIAHYKGAVVAPFDGQFRFVGLADDWIVVRWKGKNVLRGGNEAGLLAVSKQGNIYGSGPPPPGVGDTYPGFRPDWPLRCGPWLTVSKGAKYPIEVVIGETPGAFFCAFLCFERKSEPGKVYLFRMDGAQQDPKLVSGAQGPIPPGVDWSGGGYIWKPEMPKGGIQKR